MGEGVQQREHLERERRRLVFAHSDMRQVIAAAGFLQANWMELPEDLRRVIETGLVVTYARPFIDSRQPGVGPVKGRLAKPPDPLLRQVHASLCKSRNELFAHTDNTPMRTEVDLAQFLGTRAGFGHVVDSQAPIRHDAYPDIERLATIQMERFADRLEEIRRILYPDGLRPADESAKAARERAVELSEFGHGAKALAGLEDVVERYGADPDPISRGQVAMAIRDRGYMFGRLGQLDEALAAFEDLIARFGADSNEEVRGLVATARRDRGYTLTLLSRPDEALVALNDVIERYGEEEDPTIRSQVAMATFDRAELLNRLGDKDKALAAYDQVFQCYGKDKDEKTRRQAIMAIRTRGLLLVELDRCEEALANFMLLRDRYGKEQPQGGCPDRRGTSGGDPRLTIRR